MTFINPSTSTAKPKRYSFTSSTSTFFSLMTNFFPAGAAGRAGRYPAAVNSCRVLGTRCFSALNFRSVWVSCPSSAALSAASVFAGAGASTVAGTTGALASFFPQPTWIAITTASSKSPRFIGPNIRQPGYFRIYFPRLSALQFRCSWSSLLFRFCYEAGYRNIRHYAARRQPG